MFCGLKFLQWFCAEELFFMAIKVLCCQKRLVGQWLLSWKSKLSALSSAVFFVAGTYWFFLVVAQSNAVISRCLCGWHRNLLEMGRQRNTCSSSIRR